jgi:hypothetical protein
MAPIRFLPTLKPHIAERYAEYARTDPLEARGVIRATTRLVENCRSEAKFDGHTVVCDEPTDRGGTGLGPSPLEYFLSALGF